jgi:diacylglycerol diphosphate phosphatase/phosphatidate phosphatase
MLHKLIMRLPKTKASFQNGCVLIALELSFPKATCKMSTSVLMPDLDSVNRNSEVGLPAIAFLENGVSLILFLAIFLPLQIVTMPFSKWPIDNLETFGNISYPKQPEIVSFWWVLVATVLVVPPIICIFSYSYISKGKRLLWYSLLCYCVGFFANMAITQFFKVSIGRMRPDFLDRCRPVDNVCTGDAKVVTEGRHSFFSGHTSVSFYAAAYLIFLHLFWILGKKQRITSIHYSVYAMLILLASYVGVSRVQQFVHHPSDVVIGAICGSIVAWLSCKNFYGVLSAYQRLN